MKIFILVVVGILLSSKLLIAQNENANLLLQSPDGKTVKLFWVVKSVGDSITGFDIKRKEGLGDWVKLNAEPILPEISDKNTLATVESDKAEASRVKAKLYQLMTAHQVKEIRHKEYLQELRNGDKETADLTMMMARDYDLALINGFAFVDHTVTSKTDYEYGLFIQGTNNLLDTASWHYGEIPNLNMVGEITSKATTKTKGIQIIWNAGVDKIKAADVCGFNIYRQGIRLNTVPITSADGDDPSEFSWYDKSANSSNITLYSISAESMFGIEGIIKSYVYNPADHTSEYTMAKVQDIASIGYYFKEGMSVKWSFPVESEKYLKGFYLEKNNLSHGYKQVSGLLPASARSAVENSSSPVSSYIGVRVVAVYKDKTETKGATKMYIYFPSIAPPAPQNLKVERAKDNKKIAVKLSWEPVMDGDTITKYYKIFAEEGGTERYNVIEGKLPAARSEYKLDITQGIAAMHRFYIVSYSRNGSESQTSDTATIELPSAGLPQPQIRNGFAQDDKAVIQWQYPDITDLKGYKIYQDKILVAEEKNMPGNRREFTTTTLAAGTYEFTILAVSENNLESPMSLPFQVTIPPGKK